MKTFFTKILVLNILLFFAASSNAAECNLSALDLGKSFLDAKTKYSLNTDDYDSNFFTKNIRGGAVCDEYVNATAELTFLKESLAKIEIAKKSSNAPKILNDAIRVFGEPRKKANMKNPDLSSYSSFWADADKVVVYNFKYSKDEDIFYETIALQTKGAGKELRQLNSSDEE
jgi:hypothetical protein